MPGFFLSQTVKNLVLYINYVILYDLPPFSVGCLTQSILTNTRYMQCDIKLKLSTHLKAYGVNLTDNSQHITLKIIVFDIQCDY